MTSSVTKWLPLKFTGSTITSVQAKDELYFLHQTYQYLQHEREKEQDGKMRHWLSQSLTIIIISPSLAATDVYQHGLLWETCLTFTNEITNGKTIKYRFVASVVKINMMKVKAICIDHSCSLSRPLWIPQMNINSMFTKYKSSIKGWTIPLP